MQRNSQEIIKLAWLVAWMPVAGLPRFRASSVRLTLPCRLERAPAPILGIFLFLT